LCSKTATILWVNALQAKTIGYFGSKCTKTCDDNNSFFEALKASLSGFPHLQHVWSFAIENTKGLVYFAD